MDFIIEYNNQSQKIIPDIADYEVYTDPPMIVFLNVTRKKLEILPLNNVVDIQICFDEAIGLIDLPISDGKLVIIKCPECNIKGAYYRKKTDDWRCTKCDSIFKKRDDDVPV